MNVPVSEGTVVKGKYRIERVLGVGGMGVVVAAMHLALDQRVAIKFLLPEMLKHPEIVERFLREARAASKIEGDHVARVTDVDTLDDGVPFLVMEYLDGRDLSFVRRERRLLPTEQAVSYVLQAASAIAEAHARGIIHRDLKPANLFLTQRHDGSTRIKVLDFGISKMTGLGGAAEPSVTKTTAVMGSAEYMSPEQMMSTRDVDGRTDIWALGVILYELLTARVPFPGESITHVCALVVAHHPAPPRTYRPDLPPALEAIILHCLEKNRDHRFGSVRELAQALSPFAGVGEMSAVARLASSDALPSQTSIATAVLPLVPAATRVWASNPDHQGPARRSVPEITQGGREAATVGHAPSTTGIVSRDPPPRQPTLSRAPFLLAGGALLLAIGIGSTMTLTRGLSGAATTNGPAASTADPTPVGTSPSAQAAHSSDVPVVTLAPATASSPIAEPRASSERPRKQSPPPLASSAPKAPVPTKPAAGCNPPFTVDSNGAKHAKPECL